MGWMRTPNTSQVGSYMFISQIIANQQLWCCRPWSLEISTEMVGVSNWEPTNLAATPLKWCTRSITKPSDFIHLSAMAETCRCYSMLQQHHSPRYRLHTGHLSKISHLAKRQHCMMRSHAFLLGSPAFPRAKAHSWSHASGVAQEGSFCVGFVPIRNIQSVVHPAISHSFTSFSSSSGGFLMFSPFLRHYRVLKRKRYLSHLTHGQMRLLVYSSQTMQRDRGSGWLPFLFEKAPWGPRVLPMLIQAWSERRDRPITKEERASPVCDGVKWAMAKMPAGSPSMPAGCWHSHDREQLRLLKPTWFKDMTLPITSNITNHQTPSIWVRRTTVHPNLGFPHAQSW